jgi:hypothetical protein
MSDKIAFCRTPDEFRQGPPVGIIHKNSRQEPRVGIMHKSQGSSGISHYGIFHLGFSGIYHQKLWWENPKFPTF